MICSPCVCYVSFCHLARLQPSGRGATEDVPLGVHCTLYTQGYILWIPTRKHLEHIFRWSVLHSCPFPNMGALISTCWADAWVRCWDSMAGVWCGGARLDSTPCFHAGAARRRQPRYLRLTPALPEFLNVADAADQSVYIFLARVNFKIEYTLFMSRISFCKVNQAPKPGSLSHLWLRFVTVNSDICFSMKLISKHYLNM